MQHKKLNGIILRIQPHLETDRRLCVFSYEYGRTHVIAKGVRKISSHRGFHIDLFNYARMEIEETGTGSNTIKYLREISTIEPYAIMKNNLRAFGAACVIASFLLQILPEGSIQKNIFILTKKTFEVLNKGQDIKSALLTYFLKINRTLGYLPNKLPKNNLRKALWKSLSNIDPQFALRARRTLGIFSSLESTFSN